MNDEILKDYCEIYGKQLQRICDVIKYNMKYNAEWEARDPIGYAQAMRELEHASNERHREHKLSQAKDTVAKYGG
jgi:hypothetical protein